MGKKKEDEDPEDDALLRELVRDAVESVVADEDLEGGLGSIHDRIDKKKKRKKDE